MGSTRTRTASRSRGCAGAALDETAAGTACRTQDTRTVASLYESARAATTSTSA